MRRWDPGDAVALREVWHGTIFEARPATVVEDTPSQVILYVQPGASVAVAVDDDGSELRIPDRSWHLELREVRAYSILSFAWPDTPYAILLRRDPDGSVHDWYVNIQEPLRRTTLGFDTVDHALDALIARDRSSWRWKDEDELAEAIAAGLFTDEDAHTFRAAGERGVERVVLEEPPFDRDWRAWRPDPAWPLPDLPAGWDTLPG
jgi:predicted RNA-binding protein associated with RNAse of E/G family